MIGWGGEPRDNPAFWGPMLAFAALYGGVEWYRAGGLLPPTHILAPGLLVVAAAIVLYVMRGAR